MTFASVIPLRWSDLDAVGHLNNAVYLTLCEQARIEALTALGAADWSESGPVVAEATVRYRRPVLDAVPVRVTTVFRAPGRTSIQTSHTIQVDGHDEVSAEADVRLVWVDGKGRPTPVPDAVRARLADG